MPKGPTDRQVMHGGQGNRGGGGRSGGPARVTWRQANSAAWRSLTPGQRKQISQGTAFNVGLATVAGKSIADSNNKDSRSSAKKSVSKTAISSAIRQSAVSKAKQIRSK